MAHRGVHLGAAHRGHVEHDLAVIEQQDSPCGNIARQFLVVQARAFGVAHLYAGVEHEFLAGLEHDLAVDELPDPDLGALQVGHDADRSSDLSTYILDQLGALEVVLGGAMGEVEPNHVDAGADHPFEHGGVGRRRAERGDDLGTAQHGNPSR